MKIKVIASLILASGLYSQAQAACGDITSRTFKGDSAINLTYLFKNSTVASKSTSGNITTWTLAALSCRQSNRGVEPDLMPTYDCSTPTGIGPITSKALFDAMTEMGVFGDGAAGHIEEQATSIKCKLSTNGSGGTAVNPTCAFKAAWADQCN